MARQSTTPVQFGRTTRMDQSVTMTSGRAGKVIPIGYAPLLRGDSASGRVGLDVELADMPRPLLNSVVANFQAWFVPKSAHPQFSGYDEFLNSYQGQDISALGQADRSPPPFFTSVLPHGNAIYNSEVMRSMGVHVGVDPFNTDLVDAFSLIYNFRLAAHSSKLQRRAYYQENPAEASSLPRAFWPTGRFSRVVPDYEPALILGNMDLDIYAGQIPVMGLATKSFEPSTPATSPVTLLTANGTIRNTNDGDWAETWDVNSVYLERSDAGYPAVFADMVGRSVGATLADIDKARTTQAFAKLRAAYAGNDATGFDNDNAVVAELMQGFSVPEDQFKRPWLLDSSRVPFGMMQRHATDGANLDESVSRGRASATLAINVPQNDVGGYIIYTVEVLPERIYERQHDDALTILSTSELPDALRDVQRPLPVDVVQNRRIDAKHTTPAGAYGWEPMNDKWNRSFTRLGGDYFNTDPNAPWTENRSAIWQADMIDPTFSEAHYLAPEDFPHDVFADTTASAFEVVARHDLAIRGLTQIGDVLTENNDDYQAVEDSQ